MSIHVPGDELAPGIDRRGFVVGAGRIGLAGAIAGMFGGALKLALDADGPANGGPASEATFNPKSDLRGGLSFSRRGSGPPLLLLHGAGMSRRTWTPVMDRLARRYDVLAPDLPGCARSPALWGTPDVPAVADAVASWLRTLGVQRPHIVGNSFGGGVAIELWMRGAARSVTALSPIGFWSSAEFTYARLVIERAHALASKFRLFIPSLVKNKSAVALILGPFFAQGHRLDEEYVTHAIEDMLGSTLTLFETLDATEAYRVRAHETKIPLTIAWGADERLLIGRQHQRARNTIYGARHLLLPGCGHICMPDDPALVAATINETIAAAAV